jgi:hypothetical protein
MAVEAAFMVPGMFDGGGVRAHIFPVQPADAKHWDTLIAVDFPVTVDRTKGVASTLEFGAVLQRGGEIVHKFHRSATLSTAHDTGAAGAVARRFTFVEPVTIRPGHYALTAVISDTSVETPVTHHLELDVPEIPKHRAFLTDPILGRQSGIDIVVYGKTDGAGAPSDRVGSAESFRPLIVSEVDRREPLGALTHACVVAPRKSDGPWFASRSLLTEGDVAAGSVPDIELSREGKSPVQCRRMFDQLPVEKLRIGRYTFKATLAKAMELTTAIETRTAPIALVGAQP